MQPHLSVHSTSGVRAALPRLAAAALLVASSGAAQADPHRREPAAASSHAELPPLKSVVSGELSVYADTNAVTVVSPAVGAALESPLAGWSVEGSYLADIVTAASVDVVSSASPAWTEVRHEAGLDAEYVARERRFGLGGAVSSEPDYLSLAVGGRFALELAGGTAVPSIAYSFAHDTAGRVGTPFSVVSNELSRHTLTLGSELLLDRATTLVLQADAELELGDASKPYRFLPLFAPEVARAVPVGASIDVVNQLRLPARITERLPDTRGRLAATVSLGRRFRETTLWVSQRLYGDDWLLFAWTTDLRLMKDLGPRWTLFGRLRAHAQGGVYFWERAYTARFSDGVTVVPTFRTGDRELGPLVSGTVGAGTMLGLGPAYNPYSARLSLQVDEMLTRFLDALYIEGRLAHLVVLQGEVEF